MSDSGNGGTTIYDHVVSDSGNGGTTIYDHVVSDSGNGGTTSTCMMCFSPSSPVTLSTSGKMAVLRVLPKAGTLPSRPPSSSSS